MIALLLVALAIPLSIGILWVLYLAVMNLRYARDAGVYLLTPATQRMGKAVLGIAYVWDFLCNMLPVSVIFLELPHELLVTARVQRHVDGPDGWRRRVAIWFAVNMLNPFDLTGDHITLSD